MHKAITGLGALFALTAMAIAQSSGVLAQAASSEDKPAEVVKTLPATPSAKELEGRDAFSSDGQQVGKVIKANALPDGKVKDIEIQSSGFLGFFSKTYVVPVDKAVPKGGRVDLSMTSDQVKRFVK